MAANQSYGSDVADITGETTVTTTTGDAKDASHSERESEPSLKPVPRPIYKMVIFDPKEPPYDEDLLDLSIGLHFSNFNDHHYEDFDDTCKDDTQNKWSQEERAEPDFDVRKTICYKSPSERQLIADFNVLLETPEAKAMTSKGVKLDLDCLCTPVPYTKSQKPVFHIGIREKEDWIGIHDTILQLRNKWSPRVPIRYYIIDPEEYVDPGPWGHGYDNLSDY